MQGHTWSTWTPLGPCPGGRTPSVEVDHISQVLSSEGALASCLRPLEAAKTFQSSESTDFFPESSGIFFLF